MTKTLPAPINRLNRLLPFDLSRPLGGASGVIWNSLPSLVMFAAAVVGLLGIFFLPDYAFIFVFLPLLTALGMLFIVRPELAMLLAVAYSPFESDDFTATLPIPAAFSLGKIIGGLLVGAFFVGVVARRRPFRFLDDRQDLAIMMFAAIILLSGVISQFPNKTLGEGMRMIRIFIFYLAVKNLINSFSMAQATMWAMLLTTTYASGWGINEYFEVNAIRQHDIRARGVYMDANGYAALAVAVIGLGLYMFRMYQRRWVKLLLIFFLAINTWGLFLSASRGGWLALVVIGGLFIWRHPNRNRLTLLIVTVLVFSFPFWPESIKVRFFGEEDAVVESIYSSTAAHSEARRMSYLSYGLQLISQAPILGNGYSTFSLLYPRSEFARFDNPLTDRDRFRPSHNMYLEIAVGTGLIGLAVFMAIWISGWGALYKVGRHAHLYGEANLGFAASGVELALISLLITSFFLPAEAFDYSWICIAFSSSLMIFYRQAQEKAAV